MGKPAAEGRAGFDVTRDGKTAVLGTYDFKLRRPNIALFSLEHWATDKKLRL